MLGLIITRHSTLDTLCRCAGFTPETYCADFQAGSLICVRCESCGSIAFSCFAVLRRIAQRVIGTKKEKLQHISCERPASVAHFTPDWRNGAVDREAVRADRLFDK